MKFHVVALIVLLGFASNIRSSTAQDVVFPGKTERPTHIPTQQTWGPDGKPYTIPTPKSTTWDPETPHATYQECMSACETPADYNPVCASNSVTFPNAESVRCAQRCGNPISIRKTGECNKN